MSAPLFVDTSNTWDHIYVQIYENLTQIKSFHWKVTFFILWMSFEIWAISARCLSNFSSSLFKWRKHREKDHYDHHQNLHRHYHLDDMIWDLSAMPEFSSISKRFLTKYMSGLCLLYFHIKTTPLLFCHCQPRYK